MMPSALLWQSCPRRSRPAPHWTLYTLTKKLEVGQPVCTHWYTTSSKAYRDKNRCYLVPAGWVAALEGEGSALPHQVTGEDSKSEVEAVGGINVHLAQAMSHYQQEERQCFVFGSPGHFSQGCPHCEAFRQWHQDQASSKGVGENGSSVPGAMSSGPEVNVCVIGQV